MRKYYLFLIKEEVFNVYKENPEELHVSLYELYKGKHNNLNYQVSLFKQLCLPFKTSIITNYFKQLFYMKKNNNKYMYKSGGEVSIIEVHQSTIIIVSSHNWSRIFNILNLYNKKILVCDFDNHDYFWLSSQITKTKSFEYN